jgi:tetratricopeptide (TPR) repeat protein
VRKRVVAVVVGSVLAALAVGGYILRRPSLPSPDSPVYEEMTRQFYHGLAAFQVGLLDDAKSAFTRATEIVAEEPAAWANLGLTDLRLGDPDAASLVLDKAAALVPMSSDVAFLQGQLETVRGRPDAAIAHFRRAADLDSRGLRARYALAQAIESSGAPDANSEARRLINEIVALQPDNVAAILESARLAAKGGDARALQDATARLNARSRNWPAAAVEQFQAVQLAAARADFAEAARAVAVLRNVLLPVAAFREDLVAIRTPAELIAEPFERFVRLPSPFSTPSPPDEGLTFARESIGAETSPRSNAVVAFSPNGSDAPVVVTADGREIRVADSSGVVAPFPGGAANAPPSPHSMLPIDWKREFSMGLAVAGRGGLHTSEL